MRHIPLSGLLYWNLSYNVHCAVVDRGHLSRGRLGTQRRCMSTAFFGDKTSRQLLTIVHSQCQYPKPFVGSFTNTGDMIEQIFGIESDCE